MPISKYIFLPLVCTTDSVCDSLVPTGQNGTCYRGGLAVYENHQMCDVTSKREKIRMYLQSSIRLILYFLADRKILDQLKDQKPQVTFSCNRHQETCDFQCKF